MIRPIQKRKRDALNFGFRSLSFGNDSNTEKNVAGDKHGVPSSERDLADHNCSARWRTLAFTNNSEQLKPLHFVQARAYASEQAMRRMQSARVALHAQEGNGQASVECPMNSERPVSWPAQ